MMTTRNIVGIADTTTVREAVAGGGKNCCLTAPVFVGTYPERGRTWLLILCGPCSVVFPHPILEIVDVAAGASVDYTYKPYIPPANPDNWAPGDADVMDDLMNNVDSDLWAYEQWEARMEEDDRRDREDDSDDSVPGDSFVYQPVTDQMRAAITAQTRAAMDAHKPDLSDANRERERANWTDAQWDTWAEQDDPDARANWTDEQWDFWAELDKPDEEDDWRNRPRGD